MNGLWTESEIIEFNGRKYLNKRATRRVAEKYNLQLTGANMLVSKAERIIREAEDYEINIDEEQIINSPADPYANLSPEARAIAEAFAKEGGTNLTKFIFKTPRILKEAGFAAKPLTPQLLVKLGEEVATVFPDAEFDSVSVVTVLNIEALRAQVRSGAIYDQVATMSLADIQTKLAELRVNKIDYENEKMAKAIAKVIADKSPSDEELKEFFKGIKANNNDLYLEIINYTNTPKTFIKEELSKVATGSHKGDKLEWLNHIIVATQQKYPGLSDDELKAILIEVVKGQEPYHISEEDIESELAFIKEAKNFENISASDLANRIITESNTYRIIDAVYLNVSPEKWAAVVAELTTAVVKSIEEANMDIKDEEGHKRLGAFLSVVKQYNGMEPGSFEALITTLSSPTETFDDIVDSLVNYSAEETIKSIEELVKVSVETGNYEAIPSYLTGLSLEDRNTILENVGTKLGMEPEKIEDNITIALILNSIVRAHPEISKETILDYIDIVTSPENIKLFDELRKFKPEDITLFHSLLKDKISGYNVAGVELFMHCATEGFFKDPAVVEEDPVFVFEDPYEEEEEEAEEKLTIVKRIKATSPETKKKALFAFITGAGIITVLHLLLAHGQNPLFVIPSVVTTVAGIIKHTATDAQKWILGEDIFAYFCTIFGAHKLSKIFKREDRVVKTRRPISEVIDVEPDEIEPVEADDSDVIDASDEIEGFIDIDEDGVDFIDLDDDFFEDLDKGSRRR